MDEEMEDSIELTYTAVEIDLDYEFDAARYFDFTREESSAEAYEAELWFESAGSYPPSPFVTKLVLREDILQGNINTYPKPKDVVNKTLPDTEADIGVDQDFTVMDMTDGDCEVMNGGILAKLPSGSLQTFQTQLQQLPSGLAFCNPMTKENSRAKTKSSVKPSCPRTSTLMKPTASLLAKQNRAHKIGDSRLQKLLVESNQRSSNNPLGIECQAAKRQKLDGGLLKKVADGMQQSNFIHKAPKRDGTANGNSVKPSLKLTIPREPDLETTHRAQRMRSKSTAEPERSASTFHRFKALPLNRKILEAPSLLLPKRSIPRLPEFQEFHLKTSERAMHHTSASVSCYNTDRVLHKPSIDATAGSADGESRRSNFADASKQEGHEFVHNFKARPLNRKILSSKGDIGVFWNKKKETTAPMEFNLHTDKRKQQNPPIELFNKLSLTEVQQNAGSQLKLPQLTRITSKGSKENRLGSFQQGHEIKHLVKQRPSTILQQQPRGGNDGGITEVGPLSCMRVWAFAESKVGG